MSQGLNAKDNLSPELRFLVNCCQTNPSKDDIKFILSYLNTSLQSDDSRSSLNALIRLANQHGILPLVYKTIKNLSTSSSTESQSDSSRSFRNTSHVARNTLLSELKAHYMSIVQRNMLMTSELIKIMHLLRENEIEALAFKGPALSQMAYGDITLRQYSDLDILIHNKDNHTTSNLLIEYGYEKLSALTPEQELVWYSNAKEMDFYHPKKSIHIDLQWQFFDNDYPLSFVQDTLWKTASTITLNGYPLKTFSSESLLIYLCIHGSKHLWERIGWIKDVDILIRSQSLDWNKVITQMHNNDFERMFLLGIYLSNQLFHTPLPESLKQKFDNQNWLSKLNDFVINDWQQHRGMFHNSLAMIHLFPTSKMKLLYLHKVILKPSKNEYSFIDLPKGLYWVYYLVRPYLLLKKYLTKEN